MTAPRPLYMAAELVLNASLRRAFEKDNLDTEQIRSLLEEAEIEGVSLDFDTLEYALRRSLERMFDRLSLDPTTPGLLPELEAALGVLASLPFQVNLWKVQNVCYDLYQAVYPEFKEKADLNDETARGWVNHFKVLSEKLSIRVE